MVRCSEHRRKLFALSKMEIDDALFPLAGTAKTCQRHRVDLTRRADKSVEESKRVEESVKQLQTGSMVDLSLTFVL